jgi:hypothetical protein
LSERLELIAERGERIRLLSPSVGWFCGALARGRFLAAGEAAGRLVTLERAVTLVVPEGVSGAIRSEPSSRRAARMRSRSPRPVRSPLPRESRRGS